MEKIAVVGSPGAGKSTFARTLGALLDIRVMHLDRFFWLPGWKSKSEDTRMDILQGLVQEKRWIIEGTYHALYNPRFETADIIIFLDLPLNLCLWRIIKRHYVCRGYPRFDLPEGCVDKIDLLRIVRVLIFPLRIRKGLKQKLDNYPTKQIVQLRSKREIETFLHHLAESKGILRAETQRALPEKILLAR